MQGSAIAPGPQRGFSSSLSVPTAFSWDLFVLIPLSISQQRLFSPVPPHGASAHVRDQFPLFFHFFHAKRWDRRAWAAHTNIALGYASSFFPQNYQILRLSCTNVQKFSLSPTKPSPAAIPPADPPFPIHVINLPKPLQKSIPFGKNPGVSVASSKYVQ